MKLTDKTLERMKTLTELHGAPGFEDQVRDYLRTEFEALGAEIITDGLGGIFAVKKSKKEDAPVAMIAENMNEGGFMVTETQDNGQIKSIQPRGWSKAVSHV